MKHAYNKKKIDTSKYVNVDTGQPLSDELPNITSVNIKNNQLIMVDYKSYVMINKDAIALLSTMITESDMGRLLEMADMIATEFNILFTKDDKIHNRDSLAIDLNLAPDNVTRLLNKFYKRGIIHYSKGILKGKEVKTIILNPYIARNRATIDARCCQIFEQFNFR